MTNRIKAGITRFLGLISAASFRLESECIPTEHASCLAALRRWIASPD
jgi:hypothetical protein